MALVSIVADFRLLCSVLSDIRALLDRLVQSAERLSPPPAFPVADPPPVYQAVLTDLHTIDDAAQERAKHKRADLAAEFNVIPDSPAFEIALAAFEAEMKLTHGKDTEIDWREAFQAAREEAARRG